MAATPPNVPMFYEMSLTNLNINQFMLSGLYRMFEASVLVSMGRQTFERLIYVGTETDMNNKGSSSGTLERKRVRKGLRYQFYHCKLLRENSEHPVYPEGDSPGHPEGHQRPRVLESVAMRSLRQIYRVRRPWQNELAKFKCEIFELDFLENEDHNEKIFDLFFYVESSSRSSVTSYRTPYMKDQIERRGAEYPIVRIRNISGIKLIQKISHT
ncbi:hypothetical protein WN51_05163 [Melipona quadrifasciata]|uniref:Uncharacterized protein n=1 Tax=Melipona quadrifasciata TaxID=166423 RepID=A0A0N0U3P9_9HYME|nr:hypothetical protein WN51_05163 [Melipona quadrifasciata]